MTETIVCAAVQMNARESLDANLAQARALIAEAVEAGARLVVLPENLMQMGRRERDKLAIAEAAGDGPAQAFLAGQAREHGICLVGGSVFLRADPDHVIAACLAWGPDGGLLARYDKMHLFDVDVDEGESYRESASIRAGEGPPVVFSFGGARIGLSICYDLRFPELYRALARDGAEILLVPAAFTHRTGSAHWQPLLQARAIENLCAVVAPNQCGESAAGRRTWGHSSVIGPWGETLAMLGESTGVAKATVNLKELRALRRRFPALDHRLPDARWLDP